MPSRQRFELITLLAYNEILRLKIGALPINSDTFLTPGEQDIIVCSYQEFSKSTGVSLKDLSLNGKLGDGFFVSGIRGFRTMIFYNAAIYTPRVRFTLIHEVGHIMLNHNRNAKIEESEANFFASQFLMPSAIILELRIRGYNPDVNKLCRIFNVSQAAANIKLNHLAEQPYTETHLDSNIVKRFTPYLNQYFPTKLSPFSCKQYFCLNKENYRACRSLKEAMLSPLFP